jgi:hypothetical protein
MDNDAGEFFGFIDDAYDVCDLLVTCLFLVRVDPIWWRHAFGVVDWSSRSSNRYIVVPTWSWEG